jgi:hypothetical protein
MGILQDSTQRVLLPSHVHERTAEKAALALHLLELRSREDVEHAHLT